MTTQYTPKLKLALPVQGELSGTWGDVVNENITSMLEEAIAGRSVIDSWTTNAHVLTEADGTTAESRSAMLEFTDTGVALTGAATVTCPAISKIYICKNDSGQQVTITTAAGTGVDIPDGATMLVFCDGTNVVQGTTNVNSLTYQGYTVTFGGNFTTANSFTTAGDFALTLTATGATNVTLPTTGTLATLDGTETFTNKTFTSPTITSPTMTGSISATDLDISGDTTIGDAAADTLTITATVTSNITFTDDTYDIGADGATRPRSLYLSQDLVVGDAAAITGNATVGGTLGVTGNVAVNTDKVTIDATTGNTAIAGTLGVTGNITASDALVTDTISEKTATAGVTIDGVVLKDGGATVTADINFGDNDKAVFGAGSDLQIYHTGSHSYIDDTGTGNLYINSNGIGTFIQGGGNTSARFFNTGTADLYYNGAAKLATTSTGIDITGTATMDGLTVDGLATISSTGPALKLNETDTTDKNTYLNTGGGTFNVQTVDDAGTGFTKRMSVNNGTGDISFYEDTGTTAKFFWDASAESLGIGTSSPSSDLHINASAPNLRLSNTDGSGDIQITHTGSSYSYGGVGANQAFIYSNDDVSIMADTSHSVKFHTNTSERMRIDSSGNVGIGTPTPQNALHIAATDATLRLQTTSDTGEAGIEFWDNQSGTSQAGAIRYDDINNLFTIQGNANGTIFKTPSNTFPSSSEAARIDSSGNLLVGTTTNPVSSSSVNGLYYEANNYLAVANDGITTYLNRQGSDGDIIHFRKNGSTVGSIGSSSTTNQTYFAGTSRGVTFGSSTLYPCSNTGSGQDAQLDIGSGTYRFKDLYLSGGVKWANYTFVEEGGYLYVYNGSTKIMRVDSSGNAAFAGDVEANATL